MLDKLLLKCGESFFTSLLHVDDLSVDVAEALVVSHTLALKVPAPGIDGFETLVVILKFPYGDLSGFGLDLKDLLFLSKRAGHLARETGGESSPPDGSCGVRGHLAWL